MHKRILIALTVASSFIGLGCERPFVEVSTPQVTIISPADLSRAIPENEILLQLRSTSFRAVTQVLVNGAELTAGQNNEWSIFILLQRGLNAFVIEAIDTDFVSSLDTIYVLRADGDVSQFGPRLPSGIGGFATTQLFGGGVVVTGGAQQQGSAGRTQIYRLPNAEESWQTLSETLNYARVGHTGTLLPDGRILIAGGGSRDEVTEVSHLVEQVEIVDAFAPTVKEIVVVGEPIRRTYHTASVRTTQTGTVIDLFGGVGDITYAPTPRLGTRSDIRSFLLRNDTLFALGGGIGGRLGPPMSGHSQTRLRANPSFAPTQFLFLGTQRTGSGESAVSFEVDFADPLGLIPVDYPEPIIPRTRHAEVLVADGLIAIMGGRTGTGTSALSSIEVFSELAGRFYDIPVPNSQSQRRYNHAAIRRSNGTILVMGGFTENGLGTTSTEIVSLGF